MALQVKPNARKSVLEYLHAIRREPNRRTQGCCVTAKYDSFCWRWNWLWSQKENGCNDRSDASQIKPTQARFVLYSLVSHAEHSLAASNPRPQSSNFVFR